MLAAHTQPLSFPTRRSSDLETTPQRSPLWQFERLETLRLKLVNRAGRLIQPQGRLTLSMSTNPTVQEELLHYRATKKEADRKSTRLNSSHANISYAVFCLKK